MNAMSTENRKYTLKVRAEKQAETRQRIVEATSALHAEVGPARTTVAEIARRAGVQRLTVYNHFPDEKELFAACGDYSLAQNPPPDPSAALSIEDPTERLGAVLRDLYGWYRSTARSRENLERDRLVVPALDAAMRHRTGKLLGDLTAGLAAGFTHEAGGGKRVRAAVALALDFWTWRRLACEGMSDKDAADLMVGAVRAAAVVSSPER
jgi:AcrR family transcriptional regulator